MPEVVCTLTYVCTHYRNDFDFSAWFVVVSPSSGREALVLTDKEIRDFFFKSTAQLPVYSQKN